MDLQQKKSGFNTGAVEERPMVDVDQFGSGVWSDVGHNQIQGLSPNPEMKRHYERARSLSRALGITLNDIKELQEPFWEAHMNGRLDM